ncbi:hypothetical protein FB381_3682 [Nocardioides albertanoniae]|uniref:Uncharacterized protein n=1 Tax=Nocardioides albertanoniae TaxID=1175486 RepID=A0A543AB45_9ACTN|nr:hypothetical protein [Nocardioides albertanoniae]TQL69767.1 hypothetical protein FB381_3682 [Nocardioides albertanoniae]
MTSLSDFSAAEITQLLDAPGVVQKAMIVADGRPGTGQFLKAAARSAMVFRAAQQDENELVRALALALRDRGKAVSGTDEPGTDLLHPDSSGEADRAVEAFAAAVAVLRGRSEESDLEAYAAWVQAVATQVAETTTVKDGLLRRQARITPSERELLERMAGVLER